MALGEILALRSLFLNLQFRADKGPLTEAELRSLIDRADATKLELAPAAGRAAQQGDGRDPASGILEGLPEERGAMPGFGLPSIRVLHRLDRMIFQDQPVAVMLSSSVYRSTDLAAGWKIADLGLPSGGGGRMPEVAAVLKKTHSFRGASFSPAECCVGTAKVSAHYKLLDIHR